MRRSTLGLIVLLVAVCTCSSAGAQEVPKPGEHDSRPLQMLSLHILGLVYPSGVVGVNARSPSSPSCETSGGFGLELSWARFPASGGLGLVVGVNSGWIPSEAVRQGWEGNSRENETLTFLEPFLGMGVPFCVGSRSSMQVAGLVGFQAFGREEALGGVSASLEIGWDRILENHPKTRVDVFTRATITQNKDRVSTRPLLTIGIGISRQL